MTQPVGYYTNYTPGDDSLLEELQQKYGARFEGMTRREKLLLIESIAGSLGSSQINESVRDEIYQLQIPINTKLSPSDREGLIEALISQIRWGENLTLSSGEQPMQQ